MRLIRSLCLILLFFLVSTASVSACIVKFRAPDELKLEAGVVAIVEVLERNVSKQADFGELYSYKIRTLSVEFGKSLPKILNVEYFNHRAHVRRGETVCPLKDGSGLELDLKVGTEYRLFLNNSKEMNILYSETLN